MHMHQWPEKNDSSQISVAPSQAELILLLETVAKCDHKMAEILKDGWKLKRMTDFNWYLFFGFHWTSAACFACPEGTPVI